MRNRFDYEIELQHIMAVPVNSYEDHNQCSSYDRVNVWDHVKPHVETVHSSVEFNKHVPYHHHPERLRKEEACHGLAKYLIESDLLDVNYVEAHFGQPATETYTLVVIKPDKDKVPSFANELVAARIEGAKAAVGMMDMDIHVIGIEEQRITNAGIRRLREKMMGEIRKFEAHRHQIADANVS